MPVEKGLILRLQIRDIEVLQTEYDIGCTVPVKLTNGSIYYKYICIEWSAVF